MKFKICLIVLLIMILFLIHPLLTIKNKNGNNGKFQTLLAYSSDDAVESNEVKNNDDVDKTVDRILTRLGIIALILGISALIFMFAYLIYLVFDSLFN